MEEYRPVIVKYFDKVASNPLFSYDSIHDEAYELIAFSKENKIKKNQLEKLASSLMIDVVNDGIDALITISLDCPKTTERFGAWHQLEEDQEKFYKTIEILSEFEDKRIFEFWLKVRKAWIISRALEDIIFFHRTHSVRRILLFTRCSYLVNLIHSNIETFEISEEDIQEKIKDQSWFRKIASK